MKPAFFTPAAEADVEEALTWYEKQRPGLGEAFRRALDVTVASIEEYPEVYAVIHRNTRRVLLPQFPYGIYYRVPREQLARGCLHAWQAASKNVALSLRRRNAK